MQELRLLWQPKLLLPILLLLRLRLLLQRLLRQLQRQLQRQRQLQILRQRLTLQQSPPLSHLAATELDSR
jgi:hypothetical protein